MNDKREVLDPNTLTDADANDPEALWDLLASMTMEDWPTLQPSRLRAALTFLSKRQNWDTGDFIRIIGTDDRRVRRWIAAETRLSGEVLFLILGMLRDPDLAEDLRDNFTPSGLPVSETMDRMLYAFARDPDLAVDLRDEELEDGEDQE